MGEGISDGELYILTSERVCASVARSISNEPHRLTLPDLHTAIPTRIMSLPAGIDLSKLSPDDLLELGAKAALGGNPVESFAPYVLG
jgi:hypothetical protein